MARSVHIRASLFMSNQRERGRPIPRLADADKTSVDVRLPSPRSQSNVIPFAKPRALAAAAATNNDPLAHLRPQLPTIHNPARTPQPPRRAEPRPQPPPVVFSPAATAVASPVQPAMRPVVLGNAAVALAQPAPVIAPPPPVIAPPLPVIALPPTSANDDFAAEAPTTFAPPPAMAPPAEGDKWAVFERLGLGKPKDLQLGGLLGRLAQRFPDAKKASSWIISLYRLLGFSILTIIVVVLVGYITTTAFFYVSDTWVVPMAITPMDEKVISLEAQVSTQQDQRDRIADELNQAERAIIAQQEFQTEFAKAIRGDLEHRKQALARMKNLANTAAGTRAAISNQNRAYAGAARKRMREEYAAGLIDRDAMLSGKFQLAQISSSNLSLAERQAEFETCAAELEATTRSLDTILANAEDTGDIGLSYEVLQIKQQYDTSRLELAKAVEQRDSLKASLARQDRVLTNLKSSAYLRAMHDQATVAFVPYGNLADVKAGEPLYACKLTMVFCYHVGEVIAVVPGEVQFRHPHRDKNLRGQLVEVKFDDDDPEAATQDHLFVGGKPFIF